MRTGRNATLTFILNVTSFQGQRKMDYVADTKSSLDRGHYEEAFELEISTATEEAAIVYNIDG